MISEIFVNDDVVNNINIIIIALVFTSDRWRNFLSHFGSTQQTFKGSKSAIETLEKCVEYLQS